MQPTTKVRRFGAASLAIGLALIGFATLAGPASADHVEPDVVLPGNVGCPDNATVDFKLDSPFTAGTFEIEGGEIEISNVVLNDDDEVIQFDFTITPDDPEEPILVNRVLVKSANQTFVFTFDPATATGTHLVAGGQGISHVEFCLVPVVNPTDGGSTSSSTSSSSTSSSSTSSSSTSSSSTSSSVPEDDTDGDTTDGVLPTIVTVPPGGTTGGTTGGSTGGSTGGTQVAGTQTLPVTGSNDQSLAIIGAALVLMGGGALLYRRGIVQS